MGGKIWEYSYKVLTLPVKQYTVIWKQPWISCKCALQTQGQAIKVSMLREEKKWNHTKC